MVVRCDWELFQSVTLAGSESLSLTITSLSIRIFLAFFKLHCYLPHQFFFNLRLHAPDVRLQWTSIAWLHTSSHEPSRTSGLDVWPLICTFKTSVLLHLQILYHRLVAYLESLR